MATKHFCDICGKEIVKASITDLIISSYSFTFDGIEEEDKELCPNCLRELKEYFEARKNGWIINLVNPDTYR